MRLPRRFVAALLLGAIALGSAGATHAGAQAGANDPGLSRQWGLERIGAPAAWSAGFRGDGTTIAIVDSGVAADHDDLGLDLATLVDCVGHDDAPGGCVTGAGTDDAGHGTHVAGIAAARTNNSEGVAGVAPGAALLSVRALEQVCDSDGQNCNAQGTVDDVVDAIRWAADHGADVINLSLGSVTQDVLGPDPRMRTALDYAWSLGAIPVLAAGNSALLGSLLDAPAVFVVATRIDDARASYSTGAGGVRWAVAAPGGEEDTPESCESATPNGILSTWVAGSYACVAGTSMAAPHVSGALAVLLGSGLAPQAAIDRLLATADDLGAPGRDVDFGSGRINLSRALGVTATGGQGVPASDPTSAPTAGTGEPPSATGAAPAVSIPSGSTPTSPTSAPPLVEPGVTTPPVIDGQATGIPLPEDVSDTLPVVPLTVAVLAVVGAFGGHAMRYLSTASWAQRTPER